MLQPSEQSGIPFSPPPPKINIERLVDMKLPHSPGNMMRISNLLRDENASTRVIAEAIGFEPELVMRIIRLANSPLYALLREVVSVNTAIDTIGTKEILNIVIMELASATFARQIQNSPVAKKIWEHSLAVAVIARELSRVMGLRGAEEVFTCGLLHDIGKLVLISHNNEDFMSLMEINEESELLWSEQKLYGYNHAEVGSLVAKRWQLPEIICYSILHHHDPSQSDQAALVTHIINTADMIANAEGHGLRAEDPAKIFDSESFIMLGLNETQLENVWNTAKQNINEVIKSFSK